LQPLLRIFINFETLPFGKAKTASQPIRSPSHKGITHRRGNISLNTWHAALFAATLRETPGNPGQSSSAPPDTQLANPLASRQEASSHVELESRF
jgi:hypothetical protein